MLPTVYHTLHVHVTIWWKHIYSTGCQKPLVVQELSVDLLRTIVMRMIVMKKNPGLRTAFLLHLNLSHQHHHKKPMRQTPFTQGPLKHCMTLSQVKQVGRKKHDLRWLKIVSSTFILVGRYNHSLSLDATVQSWYQKTAQPLVNTL